MGNAVRGETDFQVGDRSYSLLLDVNAFCALEAELDLTTDIILAQYATGASLTMVRALAWAALQDSHPCTLEEAGRIVNQAGVAATKEAIERAMANALPEPDTANPPKRDRTKKAAGAG